jgi:hypothetical protein
MYDLTIDDFPPVRLADIVHWRNDPVVNRHLRQGIRTLEEVQEWYAQYFARAENKLELFLNKESGRLSSKKPWRKPTEWVSKSEMSVR